MTPPSRIAGALAVLGSAVALVVPAAANAKAGDKTFQQTFPAAALKCERFAAGKERKGLVPFAAQVAADCTALQTAFTNATTTVVTARATIEPPLAAARAALKAACPNPSPKTLPHTCAVAHHANDATIKALAKERQAAVHSYFATIEAARTVFWTAFKTLPGQHGVKADPPLAVPPK
jgi:uncharacterized protein